MASKPLHMEMADNVFGGPDPQSIMDLYLAGTTSMHQEKLKILFFTFFYFFYKKVLKKKSKNLTFFYFFVKKFKKFKKVQKSIFNFS